MIFFLMTLMTEYFTNLIPLLIIKQIIIETPTREYYRDPRDAAGKSTVHTMSHRVDPTHGTLLRREKVCVVS